MAFAKRFTSFVACMAASGRGRKGKGRGEEKRGESIIFVPGIVFLVISPKILTEQKLQ